MFGAKARGVDRCVSPTVAAAAAVDALPGRRRRRVRRRQRERHALPFTVCSPVNTPRRASRCPSAAVAWIDAEGSRLLVDALSDDDACRGLLAAIEARTRSCGHRERGDRARCGYCRAGAAGLHGRAAERGRQSNSSVIFDRASILKLYRRLGPGRTPSSQLGRFSGGRIHRRAGCPRFDGDMPDVGSRALAVLHALVPDAIDGWEHALEHAGQHFARVASMPVHQARGMPP